MSDFTDHLSGFTEHMKVKNYSPSSIAVYTEHLPGLFAHLKEHGINDVKRVSRDHLTAYQLAIMSHTSERTKERYSVGTICTKTRAMKRFFQYLEDSGTILINPAEHIKEPKAEKRLPREHLGDVDAYSAKHLTNDCAEHRIAPCQEKPDSMRPAHCTTSWCAALIKPTYS